MRQKLSLIVINHRLESCMIKSDCTQIIPKWYKWHCCLMKQDSKLAVVRNKFATKFWDLLLFSYRYMTLSVVPRDFPGERTIIGLSRGVVLLQGTKQKTNGWRKIIKTFDQKGSVFGGGLFSADRINCKAWVKYNTIMVKLMFKFRPQCYIPTNKL